MSPGGFAAARLVLAQSPCGFCCDERKCDTFYRLAWFFSSGTALKNRRGCIKSRGVELSKIPDTFTFISSNAGGGCRISLGGKINGVLWKRSAYRLGAFTPAVCMENTPL